MSEIQGLELGSGIDRLGSGEISNEPYVCDEYFEREKAIWKSQWLVVGRVLDLQNPGDYITFDLKAVHSAVLVLKGRDQKLRAFYNVCSHRAGRLVCDKKARGNTRTLTCPFHGWAFDLEGQLRAIPKEELFSELGPKSGLGLREISVDVWGGFVFVNMAQHPEHTLQEHVQGMPPALDAYLRDRPWTWYAGYSHAYKANWKDLMNIQHEGYHASVLHRNTLAVNFAVKDCANTIFPDSAGVCSLLTVSRPKTTGDPLARMSLVQKLSMKHGRTSNWVGSEPKDSESTYQNAVNHENSDRWVFDCYTIFPNLLLFVGASVLSVMRVWPVSAHETLWEWDWFFDHTPSNFGELFNIEHGRLATRNAVAEDWGIIELIHENMRSGVFSGTHIGCDMEATVRAHYERLIKLIPLKSIGREA